MKEQLISFETAKLAKEKGFVELVTHYYLDNKILYENNVYINYCDEAITVELEEFLENRNNNFKATVNGEFCFGCSNDKYLEVYSVPTQSLLQKWLREKHDTKERSLEVMVKLSIMVPERRHLVFN